MTPWWTSGSLTGGVIDFEANNGDLNFSGRIKANGTTRDGDGGECRSSPPAT